MPSGDPGVLPAGPLGSEAQSRATQAAPGSELEAPPAHREQDKSKADSWTESQMDRLLEQYYKTPG